MNPRYSNPMRRHNLILNSSPSNPILKHIGKAVSQKCSEHRLEEANLLLLMPNLQKAKICLSCVQKDNIPPNKFLKIKDVLQASSGSQLFSYPVLNEPNLYQGIKDNSEMMNSDQNQTIEFFNELTQLIQTKIEVSRQKKEQKMLDLAVLCSSSMNCWEKIMDLDNLKAILFEENNEEQLVQFVSNHLSNSEGNTKQLKGLCDQVQSEQFKEELQKKQQEVDQLKQELNDCHNQMIEKQLIVQQQQDQINTQLQKLSEQGQDINKLKQEHGQVQSQLSSKKQQLREKQLRIEKLQDENHNQQQKISDQGQELNRLQQEIDQAQQQLNSLNEQLKEKQLLNEQNQDHINTQQQNIFDQGQALNKLKQECDQAQQQINFVNKQLKEKQLFIEQLQDHTNTQLQSISDQGQQINRLKQERDQAQPQLNSFNKQLKEKQLRIEELQDLINTQWQNITDQGQELNKLKKERDQTQPQLNSCNKQLKEKQLRIEQLQDENHTQSQKLSDQIIELNKLKQERDQAQPQLRSCNKQLKEKQLRIEQLQDQINAQLQNISQQGQELNRLKKERDQAQPQLSSFNKQLKEKQLRIDQLQNENHTQSKEVKRLKQDIDYNQSLLSSCNMQLKEKQLRIEQLQDENHTQSSEIKRLKEDLVQTKPIISLCNNYMNEKPSQNNVQQYQIYDEKLDIKKEVLSFKVDLLPRTQLILGNFGGSKDLSVTKNNQKQLQLKNDTQSFLDGFSYLDFILKPSTNYVIHVQLEQTKGESKQFQFGLLPDDEKDATTYRPEGRVCYSEQYKGGYLNTYLKGTAIKTDDYSLESKSLEMRINIERQILRVGSLPFYEQVVQIDNPKSIKPATPYRFYLDGLNPQTKMTITKLETVIQFDDSM